MPVRSNLPVLAVLGHGPLSLVHLDGDSGLVVAVGGEGLGLLGGSGGFPLDARVLGGLPLGVVEVGGDSDDSIHDLCTEISLSSLHLSDKDGVGWVNGDLKRFSSYNR